MPKVSKEKEKSATMMVFSEIQDNCSKISAGPGGGGGSLADLFPLKAENYNHILSLGSAETLGCFFLFTS
jgi:hypothetical protein